MQFDGQNGGSSPVEGQIPMGGMPQGLMGAAVQNPMGAQQQSPMGSGIPQSPIPPAQPPMNFQNQPQQPPSGFASPGSAFSPPPSGLGFAPSAPAKGGFAPSSTQGETYQPESFTVGSSVPSFTDEMNGVMEDSFGEQKFFDKKKLLMLACAAGLVVMIIIVVVVFVVKSGSGNKGVAEVLEEDPYEIVEQTPDNDPYSLDNPNINTTPAPDNFVEVPAQINIGRNYYGDADYERLRGAGFASDEIDVFAQLEQKDVDKIIEDEKRKIRDFYIEQYQFLLNRYIQANDGQQKEAILNSWYGLLPNEVSEVEIDEYGFQTEAIKTYKKENVNYEKIPLLGNQTILKLTLNDDTVVFMTIDPLRYLELEKDSANIVVSYTVVEYRNARFITDIEEQRIN